MMLGMAAGTRSGYYFERVEKRRHGLLALIVGPWSDVGEAWEPKSRNEFEPLVC